MGEKVEPRAIVARAPSYKKGNRSCDLCLTEKMYIADSFNNPAYLNKRSELALNLVKTKKIHETN